MKYTYFKVPTALSEISSKSISQKALKLYLVHCRHINKRKNVGCSLAGLRSARIHIGLDEESFKGATEELVKKNLIVIRDDVGTGIYKGDAVEVLKFPKYNKQKNTFMRSKKKEKQHRTYEDGEYINVPAAIVDGGWLKQMDSKSVLFLLRLYSQIDPETGYANINKFYMLQEKVTEAEVDQPTTVESKTRILASGEIDLEAMYQLMHLKLISYEHVVKYQDPDDPSLCYIDMKQSPAVFKEEAEQGTSRIGCSIAVALKLRYFIHPDLLK